MKRYYNAYLHANYISKRFLILSILSINCRIEYIAAYTGNAAVQFNRFLPVTIYTRLVRIFF